MEWPNIININELELEAERYGEHYGGQSNYFSKQMGAKGLGFHVEVLEPGKFSCPYHFHYQEEELFLVLEGSAILRQGNHFREVKVGDVIFFQPQQPDQAHQFYNHTANPFKFFALSTMAPIEVVHYPDSQKTMTTVVGVFRDNTTVDYWEGETNPAHAWPPEIWATLYPEQT